MSGTLTFTFLEWGLCLWGGAFSHILYFRIQTGTRTNQFNGGLVVYVYGFGAWSRILYFIIQIGTRTNLFNGVLVFLC